MSNPNHRELKSLSCSTQPLRGRAGIQNQAGSKAHALKLKFTNKDNERERGRRKERGNGSFKKTELPKRGSQFCLYNTMRKLKEMLLRNRSPFDNWNRFSCCSCFWRKEERGGLMPTEPHSDLGEGEMTADSVHLCQLSRPPFQGCIHLPQHPEPLQHCSSLLILKKMSED